MRDVMQDSGTQFTAFNMNCMYIDIAKNTLFNIVILIPTISPSPNQLLTNLHGWVGTQYMA